MNMKEYLQKMSDRELRDEARNLHYSIHEGECFGTKDVTLLELTLRELEERGYEVEEKLRLTIKKRTD